MRLGLLLLLLPLGACASGPSLPSGTGAVRGTFGGAHALLVATDSLARIELDCAHGRTAGPLHLLAGGRFDALGTFTHEGGAVLSTSAGQTRPARFTGHLDGDLLELRIVLADGAAGPFTLQRGTRGQLYKCR